MRYLVPFQLRNKENNIVVEYNKMKNAMESGFEALKVPFDVNLCIGYPAELFDAPCNNLGDNEKLIWTAYTYLVDPPSRMNGNQTIFLAGFSWGYIESISGVESILDFNILSEKDWKMHQEYI